MANTFKVGDLEVIAVSDGTVTFATTDYFAARRCSNGSGTSVGPTTRAT
ncbi:MAG: hypothetical protein M3P30_14940 [Chloroflexota bacterium]|nr:hypothetical protein [Chloroflexota bacterium]